MKQSIQMCEGSLWKNIFFFSVPLMFAQILEVLFNLSDVAIVGKFADYTALGAVGSTTILVSLYTGFLIGMGSGVTVVIAHCLGAQNNALTKKNICSAFVACGVVGILICLISFFSTDIMLNVLNTKQELFQQAALYLRIFSLGFPCNGVQREHNKKLNNGLPILHKVPPKRDYGRYFCIMAEKGGTSHGGLTEKLSPFFHAKNRR